jgi:tRNA(Ile)-lysidine synthase
MLKRFLQKLHTLAGSNALHKRYLLAVSGGADSTVMATLFHEAGLQFAIAHCNFHLRGTDSDRDMQFVQELAARWNVQVFVREFDTLNIRKDSGKSVEMVARELRYKWFEEIMTDFDHLVTAHHANDAAETQLLNLTRGTGLRGLCGIPPVNGKTIRPMLPFTAKEIRQYAEDHHIAYVDDYTNHDEKISRNRIRHSVIPQLEAINPQFLHTNIRTRQILQQQYAFYQKHLRAEIQDMLTDKDGDIRINLQKLAQNENILLILYEILHKYGFTADTVENIIINNKIPVGRYFYSDSHILLIDRESLIIQPRFEEEENVLAEIYSMADLKTYFIVEELEYQNDMVFSKNPNVFYIPKEKLTFPVLIRKWNPGDWFYPLGAPGSQKLSDYFTDHKIDRFTKERIRLLSINDQIAWIIGYRSDERFKLTPQTKMYYRLRPLTIDFDFDR